MTPRTRRRVGHAAVVLSLIPGLARAGTPMVPPSADRVTPAAAAAALPPTDVRPDDSPEPAAFDAFVKSHPQADYDPAVKAAELPAGIGPALALVRDHVRFDSYPGVLRGAVGTWSAKAGNAADRSLLLAALLSAKHVPVRFAFGTLSTDDAGTLVDRVFVPGDPYRPGAMTPFAARVQARAERDYAGVLTALGDRLPRPAVTRDDLVREVRDHVWLQAQVDGQWLDADPSFPDAAPGKRYCQPTGTADALPADRYQTVTLRISVERLAGGKLETSTALDHTWPAADLADRQVFVLHNPDDAGLRGIGSAMSGAAKDSFTPAVWVDGRVTPGKSIQFAEPPITAAPKPAGGLGAALDALGDRTGADVAAPAQPPAFVAEYLDFDVARPGQPTAHHRRVLIDRGGPAWHAADSPDPANLRPLARDADGLVAPRALFNLWVSTGGHDLWSYGAAVQTLNGAAGATPDTPDFGLQVWPLAIQNFAAVLWGDATVIPALNAAAGSTARFYLDSPRLLLFGLSTARTADGRGTVTAETDWVRDAVRGVAAGPGSAADVARGKVWYGVAEGALEHEWFVLSAQATGGPPTATSTSGLADAGGGLTVADAAHPIAAQAAAADTVALAAVAVGRGETLVVPAVVRQPSGPAGWWSVAADGDTRAVLDGDRGAGKWGSGFNPDNVRRDTIRGSSGGRSSYGTPKGRFAPRTSASGNEYMETLKSVALAAVVVAALVYLTFKIGKAVSQAVLPTIGSK